MATEAPRGRWYLEALDAGGVAWAQRTVLEHHYLRTPVDPRCSVEGYAVRLDGVPEPLGCLLVGRTEATRCYQPPDRDREAQRVAGRLLAWLGVAPEVLKVLFTGWYGSVEDVASGRAEVTRWETLNLSRVWLSPRVQPGGDLHGPEYLPGYKDRRGVWRSTLATSVIGLLRAVVGRDYLLRRPPCFLDEPYQVVYLLSYCDTRVHRGTIYSHSGAELYRTNEVGVQTWRWRLAPLSDADDAAVRGAAEVNPRSREHRARRARELACVAALA